jgi:hypothetical protein
MGEIVYFPEYFKEYSPILDAWIDFNLRQGIPETEMIYESTFKTEQLLLLRNFVYLIHTDGENLSIGDQVYVDLLAPLDNDMLTSFYLIADFLQFEILTDILSYEIAHRVFSKLTLRDISTLGTQLPKILENQEFNNIPDHLLKSIQEHLTFMGTQYPNSPLNYNTEKHPIPSGYVSTMAITTTGDIIIPYGKTLNIFNPITFEITESREVDIPGDAIKVLRTDTTTGNLIALGSHQTRNGGDIHILEKETFHVLQSFPITYKKYGKLWGSVNDIAIDSNGQILVLSDDAILLYTQTGELLKQFWPGWNGKFLCINSRGQIFVYGLSNSEHSITNEVHVYDSDFNYLYKFNSSGEGGLGTITSMGIDTLDRVIIGGVGKYLKFFMADGTFIFNLPLPLSTIIEDITIKNNGDIVCLNRYMSQDLLYIHYKPSMSE